LHRIASLSIVTQILIRAFLKHLGLRWDSPQLVERGEALVRNIHFDDPASISRAIEHLAHDEHIDWAAQRAGIISRAFIFLGAIGDGARLPNSDVFDDNCLTNCSKPSHDDDCQRLLADHILEPVILRPRIRRRQRCLRTRKSSRDAFPTSALDRTIRSASLARPMGQFYLPKQLKLTGYGWGWE
jgi:hypothetical protein